MRSPPLLVLFLFIVAVRTTVSAPPPSTVSNRTLPYPHPHRSPRLSPTLMQELLGPNGGKRKALKAWNEKYLTQERDFVTVHPLSEYSGQYWYIEQINDYEVALKTLGIYLSHFSFFGKYADPVTEAGEAEMFTPVKNDDGSWSFHSRWNKWLSAHQSDGHITFEPENKRCEHWQLESF